MSTSAEVAGSTAFNDTIAIRRLEMDLTHGVFAQGGVAESGSTGNPRAVIAHLNADTVATGTNLTFSGVMECNTSTNCHNARLALGNDIGATCAGNHSAECPFPFLAGYLSSTFHAAVETNVTDVWFGTTVAVDDGVKVSCVIGGNSTALTAAVRSQAGHQLLEQSLLSDLRNATTDLSVSIPLGTSVGLYLNDANRSQMYFVFVVKVPSGAANITETVQEWRQALASLVSSGASFPVAQSVVDGAVAGGGSTTPLRLLQLDTIPVMADPDVATMAPAIEPWNPSEGGYVQTRVRSGLSSTMYGMAYEGNETEPYIYVTSYLNHNILRVNIHTWSTSIWAGSGYSRGASDGWGTSARFRYPVGIAWSAVARQFFVGDNGNNQIRHIDPGYHAPYVGLYAGSRYRSYGDADGPRLSARFWAPSGVVVANEKELLIADRGNSVIRRITVHSSMSVTNNSVSTVVGAVRAFALACVGKGSTLCYVNDGYSVVRFNYDVRNVRTTIAGSAGRSGTTGGMNARFYTIEGILLLSNGDLLVTQAIGDIIRRIDSITGNVSNYAGSGRPYTRDGYGTEASFYNPRGILYVNTTNGSFIVVASGYKLRTIGGANVTGHPHNYTTSSPYWYTRSPYYYTSSPWNYTWNYSTPSPAAPSSNTSWSAGYVGIRSSSSALGATMYGIAYPSSGSYIYVTCFTCDSILRVSLRTWSVSTFAGSVYGYSGRTNGFGTNARFNGPDGIVYNPRLRLFLIADFMNHQIRSLSVNGSVGLFAGSTNGSPGYAAGITTSARFDNPTGIAVSDHFAWGPYVFVADKDNDAIRSISPTGYVRTVTRNVDSPLVLVATTDHCYTNDGYSLVKITLVSGYKYRIAGWPYYSGSRNGWAWSARFYYLQGITVLPGGDLLVSSHTDDKVRLWTNRTNKVTDFAGSGSSYSSTGWGTHAGLVNPRGLLYQETTHGTFLFVATQRKLRTIDVYRNNSFSYNATSTPSPYGTYSPRWTYAPTPSPTAPTSVTTVARSFTGLESFGIAYASGTNLYISVRSRNAIYTIPFNGGSLVRIAGSTSSEAGYANGIGTTARFRQPYGIVYDSYRVKFFIADEGNNQIRSLGVRTPEVQLYAGSPTAEMGLANGPTTQARFSGPTAIATSGSYILVADRLNGFVRRIDVHGYVRSLASIRIGGSSLTALAATNYFCYTVEMYTIVRIDVSSGQKVVFAGSSDFSGDRLPRSGYPISLSSARFTTVNSLTVLSDNTLLAALGSNKIARLMPSSSQIYLYAGIGTNVNRDGVGTNASFRNPTVVQSVVTTWGEKAYVISTESLRQLTVPSGFHTVATAVPGIRYTYTPNPNSNNWYSPAAPPADGLWGTGREGTVAIVSAMVAGAVLVAIGITAGVLFRDRVQKKRRKAAHVAANHAINEITGLGDVEEVDMQDPNSTGVGGGSFDGVSAGVPVQVTSPSAAAPPPPPYQQQDGQNPTALSEDAMAQYMSNVRSEATPNGSSGGGAHVSYAYTTSTERDPM